MREQFDHQLAELRQELVSIYADVDVELHDAVDALVDDDKAKAKRTKAATRDIDRRCAELEDQAYNLIVLQQPVASDMRLLQFIIFVDFNLARMSNHARNIAKTAKRCHGHRVPGQLLDLLASQAHLVYRVLGSTAEAIVEGDLALASSLPALDAPVDELYKQFFKTFSTLTPEDDMDAATRVIMASRMLERISDNSVEVGGRLVFLLTGRRRSLEELASLDEGQLDGLYAAQGQGLTLDAARDYEIAEKIPELELRAPAPVAGRDADETDDWSDVDVDDVSVDASTPGDAREDVPAADVADAEEAATDAE
jgi:phosphate transport system protein